MVRRTRNLYFAEMAILEIERLIVPGGNPVVEAKAAAGGIGLDLQRMEIFS